MAKRSTAKRKRPGNLAPGRRRRRRGVSLSAPASRSWRERRQQRIAIHEASHAVVGRALNMEIGGATIVAGLDYGGKVWGPGGGPEQSTAEGTRGTIELYAQARSLMTVLGESLSDGEGFYQMARTRIIELLAGTEGERLLCNGDPIGSQSDEIQALAISKAFCLMDAYAVLDSFMNYCLAEARALISAHRLAVLAVAEELISKKTIDGAAIDAAIVRGLAKQELDREKVRRADWAAVIESGSSFEKLRGRSPRYRG
jgi:hypothetical protein